MFSRLLLTTLLSFPLTAWAGDDPQTLTEIPSLPQQISQSPGSSQLDYWEQTSQTFSNIVQEFWTGEEDEEQIFSYFLLTTHLFLPLTAWHDEDSQTLPETPSFPQKISPSQENSQPTYWRQTPQVAWNIAQEIWNGEEDEGQTFADELTMAVFASSGSCALM